MNHFIKTRTTTALLCLVALVLGLGLSGCGESQPAATGQKYHCPMHPTYVSDRPGDCPICNMKLVPIKEGEEVSKPMAAAAFEKTAHIKPGQYYCPMHPEVVSNAPGACPECEMNLVMKTENPAPGHEAHAGTTPGRTSVRVSPEKRQMIGLNLATVEWRELSKKVQAPAVVEHDETRYARIAPRFAGWIRKMHVNYTGAPVQKDEPLFTVYSPELFSTENEYLIAWRAAKQTQGTSGERAQSPNALLESARLRLSLFEIGEEEIRALEERDKPSAELLIRAPFSGHVITKTATEGSAFQAGETLFEIADLSHVWLRAYIFESEMPLVSVGQKAVARFPALGAKDFESELTFVYPHIDPQNRRGQVRLELDNPDHLLRPDMWANVEITVERGRKLTVPASSVIDSGQRYIAFVNGADNHLEPREVKLGIKTDDYYEVVSGLSDGDRVVSRALFLVDSESQLKAAISGMGSAGEHNH